MGVAIGAGIAVIGGLGAGIGIGIACKFKQPPLVATSAADAGMVGGFSSKIIAGKVLTLE